MVTAGIAAAVAVLVDVVTKRLAEAGLPGAPVDLGIGRLQLGYNTGVAFSMGDGLPIWAVLGVAGVVTAGVLVAIVAGWVGPPVPAGLVLGGAVANIVDRAGDGAVTDFLWLGWFPTFNLADTAITVGVIALLWASWRSPHSPSGEHGPSGEDGVPGDGASSEQGGMARQASVDRGPRASDGAS